MEYSFQSRFKFLLDKINREMAGVKNSEVLRGQHTDGEDKNEEQ